MSFAAQFLLLLWVVVSIFANGIALLHYATRIRGLELIGYGAAAGVVLHAVVGWAIAAAPPVRWIFVAFLIALTLASAAYLLLRPVLREFSAALPTASKLSLGLWMLLLVLSLGLLHLEVTYPEPLPDGLYIFKTQTTNVKVQHLTGLPSDNYIPFAVAEFILRGVSFKDERPLLPLAEVSDRTILMSLVALPFRVALGAPRDQPVLGTYNYVDRKWPDVAKLNTSNYFDQFVVVGLVLNSLLLLGLFIFCSSLGAISVLPFGAVLYLTNPYFIAQTIYTWPKALAGFFILLAWTSIRSRHRAAVVAALMALAYHSHPCGLVFAGCVGLFYLTQWRHEQRRIPSAVVYLLIFILGISPWIIWTRFVLHIPSDLMTQLFAGAETAAAWSSPINFIWVRLYNLYNVALPTAFSVYPFDFKAVLNLWLFCLPGLIGPVLIYPALAQCAELSKPRPWLFYGLIGPALLILSVYSSPAMPVLHGYQCLLGVLLFFGVWWLSRHCRRSVFLGLVGLQLAINLSLVLARGIVIGARF